jgi:transposase InsO family protein
VVNLKRVYDVMKASNLLVRPNAKLRARPKADTKKPWPTRPNEWRGIDMTKVMIEGFGWIYLVVVLDWHSKKGGGPLCRPAGPCLALASRAQPRRKSAVPAWHRGPETESETDNGCQSTSLAFLRACAALGIRQAFTSYSNPKGNADTERFLRQLWLHE